jgi:hypothetical protein
MGQPWHRRQVTPQRLRPYGTGKSPAMSFPCRRESNFRQGQESFPDPSLFCIRMEALRHPDADSSDPGIYRGTEFAIHQIMIRFVVGESSGIFQKTHPLGGIPVLMVSPSGHAPKATT